MRSHRGYRDESGHVVTNYHVIASQSAVPKRVKVSLQGYPEPMDAAVVGVDEVRGAAIGG